MNAQEIVKETLEATRYDVQAAIDALCDGEYLKDAGYTDEDQEAIEGAVADLKERIALVAQSENEHKERMTRGYQG